MKKGPDSGLPPQTVPLAIKILVALALGLALVMFTSYYSRRGEPRYNGRSLSEWIERRCDQGGFSSPENLKAQAAVRTIGANAIPCYVRWIAQKPRSSSLVKVAPMLAEFTEEFHLGRSVRWDECPNEEGLEGIRMLGADAAAAIPELTVLMNDTNRPWACEYAIWALGGIGEKALPSLQGGLRDWPLDLTVAKTIVGMSGIGTNANCAIPVLIKYATKGDISAVQELGKPVLDANLTVPVLVNCMTNPLLRSLVVSAFCRMGTNASAAFPALLDALSDTNAYVVSCATFALGKQKFDPDKVVPVLTNLLASPFPENRISAATCLSMYGVESRLAVPVLINALERTNAYLSPQVIETLGRIGPEAKDSVPTLLRLLERKRCEYRGVILESLKKITNSLKILHHAS